MPTKSLDQHLADEPYAFEFFQAVRLLERVFRDRKPVGGEALPSEEVIRFRSRIGFDFPPSEIHEIRKVAADNSEERTEMIVNFMGMAGVSGVLPTHYTELVLDRIRHRDNTLWAFLDMFTHRAVSLFYRAWAKYRFPVGYERGNDDFTGFLFDFAGLGSRGLRGRMSLEDESLLPFVGLIAQKPHSQNALENVISEQFQVPANVIQFFGQWLRLGPEDLTQLGVENSALGVTAIAGSGIWDQQSKFRVRLGPMDFKRFQAFLPSGSANKALLATIRFMSGDEVDFDLQIVLEAKQVPGTVLTTRAIRKPMVGWTTWLKTEAFTSDDDQLVLQNAS
ncbi:MAG: type VI secretion system baseplate subunit TssG [Acidobacteriota bacterium]